MATKFVAGKTYTVSEGAYRVLTRTAKWVTFQGLKNRRTYNDDGVECCKLDGWYGGPDYPVIRADRKENDEATEALENIRHGVTGLDEHQVVEQERLADIATMRDLTDPDPAPGMPGHKPGPVDRPPSRPATAGDLSIMARVIDGTTLELGRIMRLGDPAPEGELLPVFRAALADFEPGDMVQVTIERTGAVATSSAVPHRRTHRASSDRGKDDA